MTILTAEITKVNIGIFELDGLMDESGNYHVAIPQIATLTKTSTNTASRDFKRLMGKGFKTSKLRTKFNKNTTLAVSLETFEQLLFEMALKGNTEAITLSRVLIGLSLHQLFSDAFGIKFEAEERQRWLQCRFNTKHDFRPLTDQLQRYGFKDKSDYAKFIHLMQSKIGLKDGTRDMAEFEVLNRLERTQTKLTAYMECGVSPYEALNRI